MGKRYKYEQNFKPDRLHREEIDRNELRDVVVEKCFPRLRWRFPMTDHVFRYASQSAVTNLPGPVPPESLPVLGCLARGPDTPHHFNGLLCINHRRYIRFSV